MKKSTIKVIGVSAALAWALAGCDEQPKTQDVAVAEPVVQKLDSVCEDSALKSRLDLSIKNAILSAAMNRLVGLSPEQNLATQTALNQRLNTVRIDSQNPTNFADSCMVDVAIAIDNQDLVAAEYAFAQSGATLLQRATQDQVELNNGTIVAKQVTYQLVGGDVVMYNNNHNAINLIADILLAAVGNTQVDMSNATYGVSKPQVVERMPSQPAQINSDAQITTRIERQNSAADAAHDNQAVRTPTGNRTPSHELPRTRQPEQKAPAKVAEPTESAKAQASNQQPAIISKRSTQAQAQINSAKTAEAAEKAQAKPKPAEARSADTSSAKSPAEPKQTEQTSDGITIVETNETY
ncbi:hypothetical protein SAMN02745664_101128 [Moraxella cuniculi DSM 21768]|uniref:Lipoprotein n=1 Tax=Moraxella cuniculi DSM 21768 TaxID=1122245 RepID=A0A1N7DAU3_9GAMM|nr:hypothetical protein [Moraxella cuniculi]OOS07946.1 hypothetical protein B0189_00925 [Moraxella cuniculi]SIR72959.1 hypothetical protein SAMN02745664_101128 [Moraxella cuniculi DSM 21768]